MTSKQATTYNNTDCFQVIRSRLRLIFIIIILFLQPSQN